MKKSELILMLVDGGMSILEAEKNIVTEQQFIQEIEFEKMKVKLGREKLIKRANYQYDRWRGKCSSDDEYLEPSTFTYEEAVDYLNSVREDFML